MFKFDNDHIVTGYIKQLLASFNLPTYRIYTTEDQEYYDKNAEEAPNILKTIEYNDGSQQTLTRYFPYIKDGDIQEYVYDHQTSTASWKFIRHYSRDDKIRNHTKNLKIKGLLYDSYTHEYLGDYLRFLRDYDGIDLMPLYNCFSNRLCSNILLECDHTDASGTVINHFSFNSSDQTYKIFMLPVKLFKKYTIAIDCDAPVEICCGIYGKYQDTDELFTGIAHETYRKYGQLCFNDPVLYEDLMELSEYLDPNTQVRLAQRESDLKMFIKLPVRNKSSITVLEGDYLNWNDLIIESKTVKGNSGNNFTNLYTYRNHFITNYLDECRIGATNKIISDENYRKYRKFKPITSLQLLAMNTNESYPFSSNLIEYLFDNVITPMDEISDNVKRAQVVIAGKTNDAIEHYNEEGEQDGLWDERARAAVYDFMQHNMFKIYTTKKDGLTPLAKHMLASLDYEKNDKNAYVNSFDMLGYIDRRAEKWYSYTDDSGNKVSISEVDIYPDLYKDQKGE